MKQALKYSLKVWLTGIAIAPWFLLDYKDMPSLPFVNTVIDGLAMTLFGLAYSITGWLLFMFTVWLLCKLSITVVNIKIVLCIAAVLIVLGNTYAVFRYKLDSNMLILTYSATVLAAIWFYKLKLIRSAIQPEPTA